MKFIKKILSFEFILDTNLKRLLLNDFSIKKQLKFYDCGTRVNRTMHTEPVYLVPVLSF